MLKNILSSYFKKNRICISVLGVGCVVLESKCTDTKKIAKTNAIIMVVGSERFKIRPLNFYSYLKNKCSLLEFFIIFKIIF